MKRVLLYVEPHPIRNYYEEFHDIGRLLSDVLAKGAAENGYSFRVFSNDFVVDRLASGNPDLATCCLRPTDRENRVIHGFDQLWTEKEIHQWIALTQGRGRAAEFYEGIPARIYGFFPFDIILLWSENGAVRNFARRHDIPVVHGELGPTRSPFHETMYFDPWGTNGNATLTRLPPSLTRDSSVLPLETWVAATTRHDNAEASPTLVDRFLTIDTEMLDLIPAGPYVYIPLQLADDLNTLAHSAYPSPEEFLAAVVPMFLEKGYEVVIKGHPASPGRPYNLTAEIRALRHAKQYGERVHVLPRDFPSSQTHCMMGQASLVCTINSSVGFEATLLGKNAVTLGAAAYDVGGVFCEEPDSMERGVDLPAMSDAKAQAAAFACQHYFFPRALITDGHALFRILDFHLQHRDLDPSSAEYWDAWRRRFDFAAWLLDGSEPCAFLDVDCREAAGSSELFRARERRVANVGGTLIISGASNGRRYQVFAKSRDNLIIGYIEKIIPQEDGAATTEIIGWALDKERLLPPVLVMVKCADSIVSVHRTIDKRIDVVETLGLTRTPSCGFRFTTTLTEKQACSPTSLLFLTDDNFIQECRLTPGSVHGSENVTFSISSGSYGTV